MTDGPTVDGRDREELYRDARTRAAAYTRGWDPASGDAGTTLLMLFARFGSDVINRLNDVPDKHRIAFLDALGFDRRPPQSARVPVTFSTTPDLDENVVVRGGTQVMADTEDGESVIFEIPENDGFEATPATLSAAYSVDPEENTIFDHTQAIERAEDIRLFRGPDRQSHRVYFGHDEILNIERGATVKLTLKSTAREVLEDVIEWEYYGEGDEGAEGWHGLQFETDSSFESTLDDAFTLGEKMRRVSERLQRLEARTAAQDEQIVELTFRLPGAITTHTIDGVESYWIRARATGQQDAEFSVDISDARLEVQGGATDLDRGRPSMVLSNDVPLSIEDDDFHPFGRMPQPPSTLYLAAEEALTKPGGVVNILFSPPEDDDDDEASEADGDETDTLSPAQTDVGGPLSGPPEISWEYWNGNGWTRLVLDDDTTDTFREAGSIGFTVPSDLEETSVSGHADYWIRARLVGGNYGRPEYELTEAGGRGRLIRRPDPPTFGDIIIEYGQTDVPFQYTITQNNASLSEHRWSSDEREQEVGPTSLTPFSPLPDETQAVYLGFDAPLREGPINLHIPMQDNAYPRDFDTGIRWEYCIDRESWRWGRLDVRDGTEGLTERGIVSLSFPDATTAFELFGETRHWIRGRLTRDGFVLDPTNEGESHRSQGDVVAGNGERAIQPVAPTLEGIIPNTQWAYNERTVSEVVGASDGSPGQAFECTRTPITDAEVWVDEGEGISRAERRQLETDRPSDVRREARQRSESEAVWIRWTEVDDFLDSDEDARHYRLDRTNGMISFGNGQEGAIPPAGTDNIEVNYQAGGGSSGNVAAGEITELRSSISRIDGVINHKPSDGGTDVEAIDDAADRAPQQIKSRGRAVSAADFEHLAEQASRQLAKVKCEPGLDESGEWTPGWITLLIIPRERRDRPTPSLELRQRVRDEVARCAPVTLVGQDANRIVVRGPDYAEVSVDTTVATEGVESITTLKTTIEGRLEDFFHPLTGNRNEQGWAFGEGPRLSQVVTLIESIPGVQAVRDIAMTVEITGEEKIIRDPFARPDLSRDEMISSGIHDVQVVLEGQE